MSVIPEYAAKKYGTADVEALEDAADRCENSEFVLGFRFTNLPSLWALWHRPEMEDFMAARAVLTGLTDGSGDWLTDFPDHADEEAAAETAEQNLVAALHAVMPLIIQSKAANAA